MHSPYKKKRAINFRKRGYSYSYISSKLGTPKSTLSNWLSELDYTPNIATKKKVREAHIKAGEAKTRLKLQSLERARLLALKDIGKLSKRDLQLLGLGIYIGEGEKNQNVGIINSDPQIIKLAISWLRHTFGLETMNFTLAIHLYPDNNVNQCLKFWSDATGIPLKQFKKTQVDRRKGKRTSKRGKLPYGTAHLRVKSNGNKAFGVILSRRIHAWMNLVLDKRA